MSIEDKISTFKERQKTFNKWKNQILQKKGAYDQIKKNLKLEEDKLIEFKEEQQKSHQAYLFLMSEIIDRRTVAISSIEEMSTHALCQVFGDGYKLKFDTFEEKRKEGNNTFKMEMKISSPFEGEELTTGLLGERGGGVVETVSFALRIAVVDWLGYEGPILMDEAYKSLSDDDKIRSIAEFLSDIAEQTGRQFIFATHKADVFGKVADRIIMIKKKDGIAQIEYVDPTVFTSEEN